MNKIYEWKFYKRRYMECQNVYVKLLHIFSHKGNAIKTTIRYHYLPAQMTKIKNTGNIKHCDEATNHQLPIAAAF